MNDEPKDLDPRLLARYFSGSAEAARILELWMAGDPLRREYVESLKALWEAAGSRKSDWDVESAWNSVSSKVGIDLFRSKTISDAHRGTRRSRGGGRFLTQVLFRGAVAAALGAIAYLVVVAIFEGGGPHETPMREVVTQRGERVTIHLTDGSAVALNSDSRIRFPARFAGGEWEFFLTGEAFFTIKPSQGRSVIVHAGGGAVEVLGTEFNVRAWPDETDVEVVVARGKVAFRGSGDSVRPVILSGGERSEMDARGFITPPTPVDLATYLDWVSGKLVFDNTSISEVVRRLERHYAIHIVTADSSILSRRLTAVLVDRGVDEALRIVTLATDMRYETKGDLIWLFPRGSREQGRR